jgi:hypothetical protein
MDGEIRLPKFMFTGRRRHLCPTCKEVVRGFVRESAETPEGGYKARPCGCDTTSDFVEQVLASMGDAGGGPDYPDGTITRTIATLYRQRDEAQAQLDSGEATLGLVDRVNMLTARIKEHVTSMMKQNEEDGAVYGESPLKKVVQAYQKSQRLQQMQQQSTLQNLPRPKAQVPFLELIINMQEPNVQLNIPNPPTGGPNAAANLQQLIDSHAAGLLDSVTLIERAHDLYNVNITVMDNGRQTDMHTIRRSRQQRDPTLNPGTLGALGGGAVGGVASALGNFARAAGNGDRRASDLLTGMTLGALSARPLQERVAAANDRNNPDHQMSPITHDIEYVARCWITWIMWQEADYNTSSANHKLIADTVHSETRSAMQEGKAPRHRIAQEFIGKLNQLRNRYPQVSIPTLDQLFLPLAPGTIVPMPVDLGQPGEVVEPKTPDEERQEFLSKKATRKKRRNLINLEDKDE